MSKRIFHLVQAMNTVTVISFVIFCLHVCSHHGLAESESAALTIVQQEDENGKMICLIVYQYSVDTSNEIRTLPVFLILK
jgi:hypothetical protein